MAVSYLGADGQGNLAWSTPTSSSGGAPIGSILMWSNLNGAIPTGWAICDGVANSPGPNLKDKFIVGAGNLYAVDTAAGAGPTGTGAASITVGAIAATTTGAVKVGTSGASAAAETHTHPAPTASDSGHTHTTGTPNYYALYYIQRMS
jgi:hypothetical protein